MFIYLLGSGCVLVISTFNLTLFGMLAWVSKANVLAKNLKKLQPTEKLSRLQKTLSYMALLLFEVALSWIGVVAGLWQTASVLLKTFRECLVSTPEAIKLLRYPLRNNPDMSREAVWAHVNALEALVGSKQPSAYGLLELLEGIREEHPSFDRVAALTHLKSLNVVDHESVSTALQRLSMTVEDLYEEG